MARRFLELSLDEVWLRSHATVPSAVTSSGPPGEGGSFTAVERIPDYLEVVRRTALSLAEELNLPSFADWKEQYLRAPERFEREILGG